VPAPASASARVTEVSPDASAEVERLARSGADLGVGAITPVERLDVEQFYTSRLFQRAWTDQAGRPTSDAAEALDLLANAAAEGLEPAAYAADALRQRASGLASGPTPSAEALAAFDLALSTATLRLFRHIHVGRVDPEAIGFRTIKPDNQHDFVAALKGALDGHRVRDAAAALAPPLELYRGLRLALATYRALAAAGHPPFSLTAISKIEPGQSFDSAPVLRRYLGALGDLSAEEAALQSPVYETSLTVGVQRFQRRHGLAADGVIGKGTLAALSVPLATRVRQIELALERLRWLPHLGPGRFIGVNIPMFRLWAWDQIGTGARPSFTTGVIVGRAPNTRTPVLASDMSHVVLRPYWNVPASIARAELVPAWRKDPGYFARHDLELVAGQSDAAEPVPVTERSVAELEAGRLRLRQRPGPNNSLGLLKFIFPNEENVYLHSTPATELFSRSRRDFSHGCVRVEDPVGLAQWVLSGQADWSRQRIIETMQGPRPRTVVLDRRIPVILFYITAAVMPDDGATYFADDIYGHDRLLERALRLDADQAD
jgi:murein L,D-transpeptidase YcbB/YkuD